MVGFPLRVRRGTLSGEMSAKPPAPTVFVVDDDVAIREYVQYLCESVGLRVQTYRSAREFLDTYDGTRPACLVLDVRIPGMSGLDLQAELAARQLALPIIMMSAYAEIPMAVRALRAGAIDFLQKPIDGQALLERIGEMIEADRHACQLEAKLTNAAKELARLTPRQRQVLDGLLAGKRNKIIADELGLSPKTVDVHRFRIMQRLAADSLADLIRLVLVASHPGTPSGQLSVSAAPNGPPPLPAEQRRAVSRGVPRSPRRVHARDHRPPRGP